MKKILLFSALLTSALISALTSTSALADFNSALNANQNEDYKAAHKEFVSMASSGEKRSQFNLGIMYFYGQYVKKDINQAYAWLKLSNQSETLSDAEVRALEVVSAKVTDMDAAEKAFKESLFLSASLLDVSRRSSPLILASKALARIGFVT